MIIYNNQFKKAIEAIVNSNIDVLDKIETLIRLYISNSPSVNTFSSPDILYDFWPNMLFSSSVDPIQNDCRTMILSLGEYMVHVKRIKSTDTTIRKCNSKKLELKPINHKTNLNPADFIEGAIEFEISKDSQILKTFDVDTLFYCEDGMTIQNTNNVCIHLFDEIDPDCMDNIHYEYIWTGFVHCSFIVSKNDLNQLSPDFYWVLKP